MNGTALIYRPGLNWPEVRELTEEPGLDFWQEAVGGLIEAVPSFDTIQYQGEKRHCVAFCNEEGKLIGLPANRHATRLWHQALPPPGLITPHLGLADVLVGPVVVVFGDREFMEAL